MGSAKALYGGMSNKYGSHAFLLFAQGGALGLIKTIMQIYKNWLRKNGIPFDEQPFGLAFTYQGGSFIITENSGDADYFQLLMPGIADVNNNRSQVFEAANTVNREIKCVKCFIMGATSVWLATEILLDQTPEIDSIMPRLLTMLHGARMRFSLLMQ